MTAKATCRYCQRAVPIRADGKLARHHVSIPVSRGAARTVVTVTFRRLCSGSGRPAGTASKPSP